MALSQLFCVVVCSIKFALCGFKVKLFTIFFGFFGPSQLLMKLLRDGDIHPLK